MKEFLLKNYKTHISLSKLYSIKKKTIKIHLKIFSYFFIISLKIHFTNKKNAIYSVIDYWIHN
jgi:hypothetical protein